MFGATSGGFGAASSPFGAAPAANTSSFGFGGAAPATPAFGAAQPSAFGASPAASTGFGFGAPATSTGGGAFGFGAPATSTAPAAAGGFGSTYGSSFGATPTSTAAAPTTTGGFSFGAPATGGGGLFGAAPATSTGGGLFGAAGSTMFNRPATAAAAPTTGLFGAATTTGFQMGGAGQQQMGGAQQQQWQMQQQQQQQQQMQLQQQQQYASGLNNPLVELQAICAAYDDKSPQCGFKAVTYNSKVRGLRYERPPEFTELMWEQALASNPSPQDLIPVLMTGFSGLQERVDIQTLFSNRHREILADVEAKLDEMKTTRDTAIATKLDECKDRHAYLSHRVLKLMNRAEARYLRGVELQPSEREFRSRLEALKRGLDKPNQFRGRLNELNSHMRIREETQTYMVNPLDERTTDKLLNILSQQQQGLAALTKIVEEDLGTVNQIKERVVAHAGNGRA